jgi:hypothetical protein
MVKESKGANEMIIEMAKESIGNAWEDYFETMYSTKLSALPAIGTEVAVGVPENKAVLTRVYRLSNGSGLGVEFEQNGTTASMTLDKIVKAIQDGVITW